jgi:MerR family transcriptional regulator, redox-sensitive transcriptional activator SoxR
MVERKTLSIGQVASRAGVAASAIRFYEAEGLIDPERGEHRARRYHPDALRRIGFIRAAQRVGLSLAEIKEVLDGLPAARTPTRADWRALSEQWRERLDERIEILHRLRDDLDGCIGCGCLSLETCALYNPGDRAAHLGHGARYLLGDTAEQAEAAAAAAAVRRAGRIFPEPGVPTT